MFFKRKTAYELRISDWSSDVCSSYLGNLVENRHMRIALQKAVGEAPGIKLIAPNAVTHIAYGAQAVAMLADGSTVKARLCLAADGRNSPTRLAAGIKTIEIGRAHV